MFDDFDDLQCEDMYDDSFDRDDTGDDGEPAGADNYLDDADALASAGHGMDEDYNPCVDSYYEEQYDLGDQY